MIAAVALALVPALAACGGDDEGGGESQRAAAGTTQGATPPGAGATGATGPTGTTGDVKRKRNKRQRSSGGAAAGGGGGADGAKDAAPAQPKEGRRTTGKKPDSGEFRGEARRSYNLARIFCRYNTPEYLAQVYGIKETNPRVVAREYARHAFKPSQRKAAYEGCLVAYR